VVDEDAGRDPAGLVDRRALGVVIAHTKSLAKGGVEHIEASPTPGYRLAGI
jgi:hypothetical protein